MVANPILPIPGKRNILITSALPYVNNVPHLGNIIGSVLSADVLARYYRARDDVIIFICGSDEYGTATEVKAAEQGLTPAELCEKYHKIHADIYQWFQISFDIFGRTPTPQQTEIVQDIFLKLWKNGFMVEKETVQPFCPVEGHCAFLADRFVEGTCSLCNKDGARGDQCDACGGVLDPLQPERSPDASGDEEDDPATKGTGWLINPRCKLDGAVPVPRKTKHLFLRLDLLKDKIAAWSEKAGKDGGWSANCIAVTQAWINLGLKPRGITRDLKWGVPIPEGVEGLDDEVYKNKVLYVWFDAPIGYVSITKNYTDGDNLEGKNWEKWWKNPENVTWISSMGKDNIPFHSVIFPGAQIGTGDNWTKVGELTTTEYLTYEGGKFSKSRGVGVFGNNAKETGIHSDVWRFHLLSRRPESSDSEFKWNEFIDTNNNELLKNIGNLVNRVLKFCAAKMDSTVPDYTKYTNDSIKRHKKQVNELLAGYISNIESKKLRAGLLQILQLSGLGNKLLQENKLNNDLLANEPDRCAAVIGLAINTLSLLASVTAPYMPTAASSMLEQLGLDPATPRIPQVWDPTAVKPGHKIGTPALLFSHIDPKKEEDWREAYGGEEARRLKAEVAAAAAAKKAQKEKEKERKRQQKEAGPANATAKPSVETIEKEQVANSTVESVTQALEKTEVRTS